MRYGATAGLLVLLIAFPLAFPNPTVTSIGVFTMIYLIAAIGWNIFSGFSGYISIGHAAYYGLGQYTVALIAIHAHLAGGWGLFALLPAAGLVCALASIPIGFLLLRVRKHTFIVLTIAVMFIFQLLAFNLTSLTNGSGGLTMPFPTWTGNFFNMPFYYVGLLCAVVAGAVAWWVRRSKYGLGLFAIRDDEERARGLGIKVTRTKLIAYAASAFFVGIAGGLYAPFVGSVYPQFGFRSDVRPGCRGPRLRRRHWHPVRPSAGRPGAHPAAAVLLPAVRQRQPVPDRLRRAVHPHLAAAARRHRARCDQRVAGPPGGPGARQAGKGRAGRHWAGRHWAGRHWARGHWARGHWARRGTGPEDARPGAGQKDRA